MDYTFNESDLDYLGVTDSTIRALLLKIKLVGNYYCEYGLSKNRSLSCMIGMGGVDIKFNQNSLHILNAWLGKKTREDISITYSEDKGLTVISDGYTGLMPSAIYAGGAKYGLFAQSATYKCTIDEISSIQVLGKMNICGIIFDGWATLSYNDKSITIQVYDDTGLTVLGQKGVKHIKINNEYIDFLNLNDVTYDVRNYIPVNGIKIPKLPDFRHQIYGNNYYAVVINNNNSIHLYLTSKPVEVSEGKVMLSKNYLLKASANTSYGYYWHFIEISPVDITINDTRYIIASDHDIYDGDNLYFAKNIESYIPRE